MLGRAFYFHIECDYVHVREFAANTALLHPSGVFLNAAVQKSASFGKAIAPGV
jgi:hypothetical protein